MTSRFGLPVGVRRETLPAHARRKVDDASRLWVFRKAVPAADPADRTLLSRRVAEDIAHRHPELGDERVQRAHGRVDAIEFDLRDEAW